MSSSSVSSASRSDSSATTESEGTGLVMRTGEPALYAEITDELLVESTFDEDHLETLRQLDGRLTHHGRGRLCWRDDRCGRQRFR